MDTAVGPVSSATLRPGLSLGEAAADEDPAQRVLLAAHCHRRADVQVAEGVKAGGASQQDRSVSSGVAELGGHKLRSCLRSHSPPPSLCHLSMEQSQLLWERRR